MSDLFHSIMNFLNNYGADFLMVAIIVVMLSARQALPKANTKPVSFSADSRNRVGWADVAGAEEAKDELREVVDFLRNPGKFKDLGATVPRGVLLHGPPGTGKTLLARAAASEAGAKFYAVSASGFVETFAGLGAARVRSLFKTARKRPPAIIFIDELDAIGSRRGTGDTSGEKDKTLNQLLVEMDGFGTTDNVVVIGASNMLSTLDEALLRPGRFDRHILVGAPDLVGREAILKVHTRNKRLAPQVDLGVLARTTAGLTGASLAHLANEAAIVAGRASATLIAQEHFEMALERVIAGVESRKVISDHEKQVIAHHEAGHALASELLPRINKVHKISLVPRGNALGYALNLPDEDRYLQSKHDMEDWLVMLLAGRAAEQVIFDEVTTGAADDLDKAYAISRGMVTQFGFADGMGVQRLPAEDYSMSEHTRRRIDDAQQAITERAWQRALALISQHESVLRGLASQLLSAEVIERTRIVELCAPARAAAGVADAAGTGS